MTNILLYDGECKLCNWAVRFVLKHEKEPRIKFAALQSGIGQQLLQDYQLSSKSTDSVVFIFNKKAVIKSEALMEISLFLKYPFRLLNLFKWFPVSWLNAVYDLIAKYRMKVFGKMNSCKRINSLDADRFLD